MSGISGGGDLYMDYEQDGGLQRHDRHICEVCGANPRLDPNVVLFRANEKGKAPVWRCKAHYKTEAPLLP